MACTCAWRAKLQGICVCLSLKNPYSERQINFPPPLFPTQNPLVPTAPHRNILKTKNSSFLLCLHTTNLPDRHPINFHLVITFLGEKYFWIFFSDDLFQTSERWPLLFSELQLNKILLFKYILPWFDRKLYFSLFHLCLTMFTLKSLVWYLSKCSFYFERYISSSFSQEFLKLCIFLLFRAINTDTL